MVVRALPLALVLAADPFVGRLEGALLPADMDIAKAKLRYR